MALTLTSPKVLTAAQASAGATTFTTGTFTPVANRLYMVHIVLRNFTSGGSAPILDASATGASSNVPALPLTAGGTCFKQYAAFGTNYHGLYAFLGAASPTNGALVFTRQSTNTWDLMGVSVTEFAGNVTSGVSGACIQSVYGENAAATVGTINITMGSGNGLFACWASYGGGGGATTPRASWTETDTRSVSAQYGQESEGFIGTDTAGSVTFTNSDNIAGFVVEIKAAAGATLLVRKTLADIGTRAGSRVMDF